LEARIREILYDDYGRGDHYIESSEIYDKLIKRGITVPENAISEVLSSLHKQGLIKAGVK
jgi:hypothetical protein